MILEGGNIYNHSGLSRNWLHQDMLPGNVQMRRQVVYNATGYHYQEGCQFILVDHGGGCLIVNGDAYSLEAGSCSITANWRVTSSTTFTVLNPRSPFRSHFFLAYFPTAHIPF